MLNIMCQTGNNTFGQLGHGNQKCLESFRPIRSLLGRGVSALQAADHSSAAICDTGDVFMWGRNDHCQLGLGDDIR